MRRPPAKRPAHNQTSATYEERDVEQMRAIKSDIALPVRSLEAGAAEGGASDDETTSGGW